MRHNSALNKHVKEAVFFRHRVIVAIVVVCILALILLSRLVYLQLIQHQFFSTLSRQNLLNIIPLKPSRGLIYDRNGVVMAKNIPSYSLAIIPEKIGNFTKTVQALRKLITITDDDIKQYNRYRNQYRQFNPVPLKMKLTEEEIARFYVNQHFFPGVIVQARPTRFYPFGDTSSEVVGYVGRINQDDLRTINLKSYDAADDIGKNGVEKYYETVLHGRVGSEEAEINAAGRIVRSLKRTPPEAGKNIYLTIDSRLQAAAHEYLGEENGSVVMIKPKTGEILALVSHPTFDSNTFARGISQKEYQALLLSPDHPLFNRAIRGQYAAASTVKPFIAVSSLDVGIITTNSRILDMGWFQLPNTTHIYRDWKKGGHGWVNVSRAIEVSCDTFFYHLASHLGIRQLHHMLAQFGFGKKTNIDLPGEEDGLAPSPKWKWKAHHTPWYTGDTIETVIGQGFFLTTPLQLAAITATLANRGTPVQPHVLLKTIDEDGEEEIQAPIEKQPVDIQHPESWQVVINAMRQVVEGPEGTARYFGPRVFPVAAKTGTAEIYHHSRDEERNGGSIPKKLRNHHLFIAFSPVDHPEIAIAIVIEHSANCDKIAAKLFNFYFTHNHETT